MEAQTPLLLTSASEFFLMKGKRDCKWVEYIRFWPVLTVLNDHIRNRCPKNKKKSKAIPVTGRGGL
jgi:hypothetical protein